MKRQLLTDYLSKFLSVSEFNDMCPNGLQVSGFENIEHIVTGVSASVELFEQAVEQKADTVIVHHGIIWDFARPLYQGGYRERLKILLQNNINLYAFHLPLDAHPDIGNNAELGKALNLQDMKPFGDYRGQIIGMRGDISPTAATTFFTSVENIVGQKTVVFPFGPEEIKHVGVMSGGAQKEISQAVNAGLDVYLTGEVSEHIMHYAKEEKIHFISAGHYATERFGIRALGDHLAQQHSLKVSFIDIPNPV
jgi:dinuclear metal center YbgI/SA1388 family protein